LIDRVSVRFIATTRVVSVISAALVAVALQLDTVNLINRLAMDEQMRSAFVELAPKLADEARDKKQQADEVAAKAGAQSQPTVDPEKEKFYLNFLAEQGLISLPNDWESWRKHWRSVSLPGLILSIFLLSLGGPFWYNALGKLLQLRSGLARKDEEQKNIRQTTQSVTDPRNPDNPSAANPLQGERGDLKALG
jgi:hypothetical protein